MVENKERRKFIKPTLKAYTFVIGTSTDQDHYAKGCHRVPVTDKRIWEIQDEVAIIQKIRKTIRKIKFPPGPQREKNERIKDLISKSRGCKLNSV